MLQKELRYIEKHLVDIDKEDLDISKANVGWHIDHSLKVINTVFEVLKNSNPQEYKKKFNLLRVGTFALGAFPRGKARSPKRVLPPETIVREDIEKQIAIAVLNLKTIDDLGENQYFVHPLFKQLNKKQTLQFLKLHTHHHLKIVKDILK
jgi:hypothetical protein